MCKKSTKNLLEVLEKYFFDSTLASLNFKRAFKNLTIFLEKKSFKNRDNQKKNEMKKMKWKNQIIFLIENWFWKSVFALYEFFWVSESLIKIICLELADFCSKSTPSWLLYTKLHHWGHTRIHTTYEYTIIASKWRNKKT